MKLSASTEFETNIDESLVRPSLWTRYKSTINFKADLKSIFFRPHAKFATLDGARAITILLMVLFHVLFGIAKILDDKVEGFIAEFPGYFNWMWQAQGSDPLFVMCGLLVSYSLFREYDRNQSLDVMRFFKRRLMRIYPLFLLALLIFLPTNSRHDGYILSNLLFSSNYFEGQKPIIPVGWSLEVQMQFYFMLPFICLLMYKIRWRLAFLVGLCIAAVVYRYWWTANHPELYLTPFYEVVYNRDFARLLSDHLYYDLDARIGAFFMGMLVAYLHHYYGKVIVEFFKRNRLVNAFILLLGIYLIAWSFSFPLINKEDDFYAPFDPGANLMFLVFNRYVYSFGMSILLLMALCPVGPSRIVKWILSWPIWHPFAQLIFSIYLFHFVFIVFGAAIVFGTLDKDTITSATIFQVFGVYFWALVLTVIFSSFAHIYIEKPFLRLREA